MTNIAFNVVDCKINDEKCNVEEIMNMVNKKYEKMEQKISAFRRNDQI